MRSWIAFSVLALGACAAETSSPAVPDHFEVARGDAQIGTPGRALDSLIELRLLDDRGEPIVGAPVQWRVTSGGGTVTALADTTGADGMTTARWTLGVAAEAQGLRAFARGVPSIDVGAATAAFRASAIAVGDQAACALDLDGAPWCWANGEWPWDGTLYSSALSPTPTRLETDQKFVSLVGGMNHWCALTADHRAWCWSGYYPASTGRNTATIPRWTPAPVENAPDFAMLGSGQNHTCGIDLTGQAWCWGLTEDDRGLGGFPAPFAYSLVKVPQSPGVAFTRVASGWAHNCAIATDGGVWCWGYDNWGDLGDTIIGSRNVPSRVPLPGPAREVAAGDYHSCAALSSGPLYCWGFNFLTFASGFDSALARPRLVDASASTGLTSGWYMVHVIRSGQVARAGSMVSTSTSRVADPQLSRSDPHSTSLGISGIVEVSGQTDLACGRISSGEVYCWGNVPGVGWTTTAVAVPAP